MTKLLLDGDWLCFSTAIVCETKNPFNPELPADYNEPLAQDILLKRVANLSDLYFTDDITFYFSCSREDNWRRTVDPSYKANRNNSYRPIGLTGMKEFAAQHFASESNSILEADDLIGIAATDPSCKDERIIVSVDKDFLTIPNTEVYNPVKEKAKKNNRTNAFKMFIYQVIIGDSSDGYKGFKGVGPKGAVKFIAELPALHDAWYNLLELGKKKGHNEDYILSQARLAHILTYGDFDFNTNTVKLWEPSMIPEML
jgi:DNA polymerase-1